MDYPQVYSDELLAYEFELLKKAQKEGVVQIELMVRSEIIRDYHVFMNHELSIEHCEIQAKRLETISSADIPDKARYYIQIGNRYYDFKDYPKAISFYEKALNETATATNQFEQQGARNNMGLCYRYGFNDFERSDSCFYAIVQTTYLNPKDEERRSNWDGIAEGNIAYNMLLREEYDAAIPLLNSSLEKVLKYGENWYAAGVVLHLANIYLKKGNPTEAKRYIDMAIGYYSRETDKSTYLYETLSKYYTMTGNATRSIAYMDSMQKENKRREDEFNAQQIMRVEQRKHLSEQALKDEQIKVEQIRSDGYRRSLTIVVAGSMLLGLVLLLYLILYNKKRAAYRELVRRSQEWAQTTNEHSVPDFVIASPKTKLTS
jgi:tetratricopeptide (TPR) repeat protein